MADNHPDRELLTRYVRGELISAQKQRVKKHVSSCTACQQREHKLFSEIEKGAASINYDLSLKHAAENTLAFLNRLDEETELATQLLRGLREVAADERLKRIDREPQFHSVKLFQLLQHRCRAAWLEQPVARAVDFAQMGVVIASHLSAARYGSGLVADSQALAWAHLGNSHRIACDQKKAEQALRIASEHQKLSGDPLTESEILLFLASLRRSQGRFEESTVLYDRVIKIYREGEDRHGEGRALIAKGTALGDRALGGVGGFQESIRLLRKGVMRINPSTDPELTLTAHHNLLSFLAESGRHYEAQQALEKERHLYAEFGRQAHFAKLPWVEGIIAEGFGRLVESQAFLRNSREILNERQCSLDSALVSLRLGIVLSKQGHRSEARQLAEEVIPIFESLEAFREASAARLLFLHLR